PARAARAASTAARMSLTPAITADNAMNCAFEACAISRASVVLPAPGGPHRISECSCPASMLADSGLPGPRMCRCPRNSLKLRGRMRSASGRNGSRSLTAAICRMRHSAARRADDIGARGRGEAHLARAHRAVTLDLLEDDGGCLVELVLEDHALEVRVREAEQRAAEV